MSISCITYARRLVVAQVRPVLHDPPKDFRREAPEGRKAPSRAAPPVVRLRRQHQRESIEVAVAVARPAARVDHLLDIRVSCLGGELGAGAQEEGVGAGAAAAIECILKRRPAWASVVDCKRATSGSRVDCGASSQQ